MQLGKDLHWQINKLCYGTLQSQTINPKADFNILRMTSGDFAQLGSKEKQNFLAICICFHIRNSRASRKEA